MPDLKLTGQDVHNAYCRVEPQESKDFEDLPLIAQQMYNDLATELNKELDTRQAWFEGEDKVTITAIRCPQCNEMLQVAHAEGHACWLKEDA